MKRYIKSDINIREFENQVDRYYDRLFEEYNKEREYTESTDGVWVEFTFKNTLIPIENGDITEEGWDILENSCSSDDLSSGDCDIYIDTDEAGTMDAGTVLEGIRDCILEKIPDLPEIGKYAIKISGIFELTFPMSYKEYTSDWDRTEYTDIDIGYTPICKTKDFSYKIL